MSKVKAVLFFLLISLSVSAETVFLETFHMDRLETEDLQLLYFDPPQTYLVPHVTLSFYNSLKFQRDVLGWKPYDKTTVLLKDFSDYGNAAARSAPNNAMIVDVAPLSRTFETFSASERIFMLMNHELTHVATMDASSRKDRAWRKFFGGKPTVDEHHPETILYSYLVTPRVSVPRWYLESESHEPAAILDRHPGPFGLDNKGADPFLGFGVARHDDQQLGNRAVRAPEFFAVQDVCVAFRR